MNNQPGTRAKITQKSRNYIIARAIAPPRIGRKALAKKLQKELEEKGWDVPEKEVLWKKISEARNQQPNELDRDWTLGSLAEYPIPPEALPLIGAFQMYRLTTDAFLSIREAQWAGRLYNLFSGENKENPLILHGWAFLYALEETLSEVQGNPHFDSYVLDTELMHNVFYGQEAYKAFSILGIADKYDADPFKLRDLNLSLYETEEAVKANPEEFIWKDEAVYRYTTGREYLEDYNKELVRITDKIAEMPGGLRRFVKDAKARQEKDKK